jgi:hypothetical protein
MLCSKCSSITSTKLHVTLLPTFTGQRIYKATKPIAKGEMLIVSYSDTAVSMPTIARHWGQWRNPHQSRNMFQLLGDLWIGLVTLFLDFQGRWKVHTTFYLYYNLTGTVLWITVSWAWSLQPQNWVDDSKQNIVSPTWSTHSTFVSIVLHAFTFV